MKVERCHINLRNLRKWSRSPRRPNTACTRKNCEAIGRVTAGPPGTGNDLSALHHEVSIDIPSTAQMHSSKASGGASQPCAATYRLVYFSSAVSSENRSNSASKARRRVCRSIHTASIAVPICMNYAYPQWANHPLTSAGVIMWRADASATSSIVRVRAALARNVSLTFDQHASIGERSGE